MVDKHTGAVLVGCLANIHARSVENIYILEPKKLRAKKQAAQAAIEARAEREFQARYDDHQNEKEQMFVRLGMSQYYGSEG